MATTIHPSSGRKPKRGDLVILATESRVAYVGAASETVTAYSVGIITSVSRDGQIKSADVPSFRGSVMQVNVAATRGTAHHAPASAYDVRGILQAYSSHTYMDSDMVKPYSDPREVRAMIDQHRISEG